MTRCMFTGQIPATAGSRESANSPYPDFAKRKKRKRRSRLRFDMAKIADDPIVTTLYESS